MTPGRLAAALAGLALLGAAASCQPDSPTELVVVVRSDMAVPSELDEIRIRVWGPDAMTPVRDQPVDLGFTPLPTDFVVRPRDGDASRTVSIQIDALRGGRQLFATRAVTAFSEGRVRASTCTTPGAPWSRSR